MSTRDVPVPVPPAWTDALGAKTATPFSLALWLEHAERGEVEDALLGGDTALRRALALERERNPELDRELREELLQHDFNGDPYESHHDVWVDIGALRTWAAQRWPWWPTQAVVAAAQGGINPFDPPQSTPCAEQRALTDAAARWLELELARTARDEQTLDSAPAVWRGERPVTGLAELRRALETVIREIRTERIMQRAEEIP